MAEGENIRVLVVEPAKVPYERTISTLEEMQEIVGGHIETVHPFADDPVALVVNENGKMLGLPYNRAIMDESGLIPEDMIQGTFFIAGVGSEDFVSLTDEQAKRYTELYTSQTILTAEQQPEKLPVQEAQAQKNPQAFDTAEPVPVEINHVVAFPDSNPSRRNIRFIDSSHHDLFYLPDGSNIVVTSLEGKERTVPCHYIDAFHTEFGTSVLHIAQFAERMEQWGSLYRPEQPREGDILDTYEIYQLRDMHGTSYASMPYEYAKGKIRPEHYRKVYAGVLAPKVTLENLFHKHNQDCRPLAKQMRAVSMSDIIVCMRGGERQAFYVDRVGFTECKEFFKPPRRGRSTAKKAKKPER